jgi:hypothetical protein
MAHEPVLSQNNAAILACVTVVLPANAAGTLPVWVVFS